MKIWMVLVIVLMTAVTIPAALAAERAELDTDISAEDQARFDAILQPVMKIYNFIKYVSSAVAVIFLLYAGISFMSSGSDPRQRDTAKSIATYVILGLLIIWAAPMVVQLLI